MIMNPDGTNPRILSSDSSNCSLLPGCWSPDGKSIAYWAAMVLTFNTSPEGPYGIYRIDLNFPDYRLLTSRSFFDFSPVWSPDGKRIAFYSYRDLNYELYIMHPDGSRQARLTNDFGPLESIHRPIWSPVPNTILKDF
jgi:TolB protein